MIKYEDIEKLHLEVSSKCNAACVRCPRNVDGGFKIPGLIEEEFTLEKFKTAFSSEFLQQIKYILFCGDYGDAGTCKDLNKILKYIKQSNKNTAITLTTNGSVRDTKFWQETATILDSRTDAVRWSIDGLEDTNHLYRKNTIWTKIIENVTAFIDAGGAAHWDYLIFGHNEHQIKEAEELSKQLGFKMFFKKKALGFIDDGNGAAQIHTIGRNGRYEYSIDAPSDDNLNIINKKPKIFPKIKNINLKDFYKEYNNYKKNIDNNNYPSHIIKETEVGIDCAAVRRREIYVDASGGVHPCCYLGHVSQENATGYGPVQYLTWIRDNVGLENINCFSTNLRDIVESDYFDKIKKTWDAYNIKHGKLLQCVRHCSIKDNMMKNIYNRTFSNN